jgi:hypothetical protein
MKLGWVLTGVLAAGCATSGALQSQHNSGTSTNSVTGTSALVPNVFPPSQQQNIGPSIVLPVTGGAPVIAVSLGGDIFLPVTGGVPVIGIPTSP